MVKRMPDNSPLRKCFKGMAWGMAMYQILHDSRITLNHHIGVSNAYANNMRLYEATGVGTLLLTDWKQNLPELFEPGEEVVVYRNPEECVEAAQYYLEHEEERKRIAALGQKRTLRDHTYGHRMREFLAILKSHFGVS
jgi:spore maturation protein CgeB